MEIKFTVFQKSKVSLILIFSTKILKLKVFKMNNINISFPLHFKLLVINYVWKMEYHYRCCEKLSDSFDFGSIFWKDVDK